METGTLRPYGVAAIVGALAAIAGNAWLFLVDPSVPSDRLTWPLTPHAYVFMQLFFAATQLLMALGIVGLVRSDVVDPGRWRRVLETLAITGMALTVPGELVLILVRHDAADASAVDMASTVFGVGLLLADIGLIGFGVLTLRQRNWAPTWAALPLVLAVFQLVVVTPVSFAFGFTSVASNVAIGIADLMIAAIGLRLLNAAVGVRGSATESVELGSR